MSVATQTVTLLSGNTMPIIGAGTGRIRGTLLVYQVIELALQSGYRSFDTAAMYRNEIDIGLALKELLPKYNLTREDLFITSKLSPDDHGEKADEGINRSLKNLGLDYLDLYLIHWPGVTGLPSNSTENKKLRNQSWQAMINAQKDGRLKAIGVSNYEIHHIEDILKDNLKKPDVNQVEFHAHWHKDDLLNYCRKHGIRVEAYSPLGSNHSNKLREDPVVNSIAKKLNKSTAQVLLRWAVQQGVIVIPRSRSKAHFEENLQLDFEIPEEDMKTLSSLKHDAGRTDEEEDPINIL